MKWRNHDGLKGRIFTSSARKRTKFRWGVPCFALLGCHLNWCRAQDRARRQQVMIDSARFRKQSWNSRECNSIFRTLKSCLQLISFLWPKLYAEIYRLKQGGNTAFKTFMLDGTTTVTSFTCWKLMRLWVPVLEQSSSQHFMTSTPFPLLPH